VKQTAFHWEVKDLLIQFLAAFDNVVIKRYNAKRVAGASQQVRYVYAPKQRVLYDLINPGQNLTLPVVSVTISSITRDVNRVFNKNAGFFAHGTDSELNPAALSYYYRSPVPVNIDVKMHILTRYQSDMDQILSNFIPYNNPYIVVSWTVPKDFNLPYTQEIRTEVMWNGSINMDYPIDINGNQKAQIIADTSFTIKGFLFPAAEDPVSNIFKIDTNFSAVSTQTDLSNFTFEELLSQVITANSPNSAFTNTEIVTVSGRPQITNVAIKTDLGFYSLPITNISILTGTSRDFIAYGNWFEYQTGNGLYVSSNNFNGSQGYYDLFSNNRSTSAGNPPFSAYAVNKFQTVDRNTLTFTLSALDQPQKIDIIYANEAGYALASDSKRFDAIEIVKELPTISS